MNLVKIIIFIVAAVLIISAIYSRQENVEQAPWQPTATINNHNFVVEVISTATEKEQGLSGREFLAEDNGMLFLYDTKEIRAFWMKDMRFDIDLLWINDQEIVGIEKLMTAPDPDTLYDDLAKYNSPQPVNRILEFPAGTIDKYSIQVGDIINFDIYDRNQVEGN
jgi:uncharacterized protein